MSEESRARALPVFIGILIVCVFLAVLAYLAQSRRNTEDAVPTLTLISPAPDQVTDSPLVVRFTSDSVLKPAAMGWGAAGYHLHAWINDVQYMPAAADIKPDTGPTYLWQIPSVPRGIIAVRLGWADAAHRPVSAGTSQTISSVLR